jgi:hypothetical protein
MDNEHFNELNDALDDEKEEDVTEVDEDEFGSSEMKINEEDEEGFEDEDDEDPKEDY